MRMILRPGFILLLCLGAPPLAWAAPAANRITLATVPGTVYKLRDPGRAPAESWLFHVVVTDREQREDIQPAARRTGNAGRTLRP